MPSEEQCHARARSVMLFTILSSILLTPMTTAARNQVPFATSSSSSDKKDAAPDKIAQVTKACDLKGKIPGITAFEDGINNSPEGRASDSPTSIC